MDQQNIERHLTSWGLASFIPNFKINEIDKETFFTINGYQLDKVIPTAGPQSKFLKNRESLDRSTFDSEILSFGSSIISSIECSSIDTDTFTPCHFMSYEGNSSAPYTLTSLQPAEVPCSSPAHVPSNSVRSATQTITSTPAQSQSGVSSPAQAPSVSSTAVNIPLSKRGRRTTASIEIKNLNIKDLLDFTASGQWVLRSYEADGYLEEDVRDVLVHRVIDVVLAITEDPCKEDFISLAENIIALFPTEESVSVYYVPPLTHGVSQRLAQGKLFDRVRNQKFKLGLVTPYKKLANDLVTSCGISDLISSREACPEEVLSAVVWLERKREPWEEVKENWIACERFRIYQLLHGSQDKVSKYLNDWPVLRHSTGYLLLESDFRKLYGASFCAKLLLNWPNFQCRLISLAKKRSSLGKDDKVGKSCLSFLDKQLSDDEVDGLVLELIPSLMRCSRVLKVGKKSVKVSVTECRDAFVQRVNAPNDVKGCIDRRKKRMQDIGGNLQPYILMQGVRPTVENVYVVIDDHMYVITGVRNAVDYCFKSFFALHCCFPQEAEHVWSMLQKYLFQLKTNQDKEVAGVNTFITRLKGVVI